MQKVWQQIGFEKSIYDWLIEEKIGRRHKNLSETVNELFKNYQIMIRSVDRARELAEKKEQARIEAERMIASYRGQLVNEK